MDDKQILLDHFVMKNRPAFENMTSFEEFNQYYWYRQELSQICKELGIDHHGTKQELNNNIQAYFSGELVKRKNAKREPIPFEKITRETSLLACGFSFNLKFRAYFSSFTGVSPFKFTADMAAAWRKVKNNHDTAFTIQDMLDIYDGKSAYAVYDHSSCQWNQFVKDFCADEKSRLYANKLKVAALLWQEVRNSTEEKTYSRRLLDCCADKISVYKK